MSRILAIDYGQKRVGIAVTDPLQMIATPLDTVHAKDIFTFLHKYTKTEDVEMFVIGLAKNLNNSNAESVKFIKPFVIKLKKAFPETPVKLFDERFTSVMAQKSILAAGAKKKDRQNKALVDKVSATILLQSFMQSMDIGKMRLKK
jgi:putative Holliday junction resolvase